MAEAAETVTVRVAVAVDPEGNWTGWGIPSERLLSDFWESGMIDDLRPGERYYILVAELEVPLPVLTATEVTAIVVRADPPALPETDISA